LELARRAAAENDCAVVSVFVNPLQFNDPSDFERYPRDFSGDSEMLAGAGCAMVFTGTLEQFFPGAARAAGAIAEADWLDPGPSALGLEGESRPGHFRGVATIVARLFELVEPTRAYFGQKDFQQTLVVQDLARARGGPHIEVCATSREISGLARSSRNQFLSAAQRAQAAGLFESLCLVRSAWLSGERGARALAAMLEAELVRREFLVEYAQVRDPQHWTAEAPTQALESAIALLAVRLGRTRLLDNLRLDEPASGVR
jgi:pantoate--beta-alanine ligase